MQNKLLISTKIFNYFYVSVAIRSGDYYMFDELDDEEIDFDEPREREEDEADKGTTRTLGEVKKTNNLFRLFYLQLLSINDNFVIKLFELISVSVPYGK